MVGVSKVEDVALGSSHKAELQLLLTICVGAQFARPSTQLLQTLAEQA